MNYSKSSVKARRLALSATLLVTMQCSAVRPALSAEFCSRAASAVTVLFEFDGRSGANPWNIPVFESGGALYGTARYGGEFGHGVLYKFQSNNMNVLHSFSGMADDGADPQGLLVGDNVGNLYGTTAQGGKANLGTVYRWDPGSIAANRFRLLHSFIGDDGAYPMGGLTRDGEGNLYGSAHDGGLGYPSSIPATCPSTGCGTLFTLNPLGDFLRPPLKLFDGMDGLGPFDVTRYNETLFGGTHEGGTEHGVLFNFPLPSGPFGPFSGRVWADGYDFDFAPVSDSAGNLYGAAETGGLGYGVLFRVDAGGSYSVIHAFNGADGSHPTGHLIYDESTHKLYGTTMYGGTYFAPHPGYSDTGYGTIFEFNLNCNTLNTLYSFDNAHGSQPGIGVARDPAGNLYGVTQRGGAHDKGVLFRLGLSAVS